MVKKLEVKITTQSFSEAGGLEVFPDLEMYGILIKEYREFNEGRKREGAILSANELLKKEIIKLGITHIFGIKYELTHARHFHIDYDAYDCLAIGTGYKPKK
ncbi:MAG: hypothetical protein WC781_02015 [Candidatus Pacearchaeota archaeon]|jgi:hypothetical protein